MSDTSSNNDTNDSNSFSSNIVLGLNTNNFKFTENYQQIIENINLCKKIINNYKKWYEDLKYSIANFIKKLNNYCINLQDLINNTNTDLEWDVNFTSFQNCNKLYNLQSINEAIDNENLKKEGIKQSSNIYLKFLDFFSLNNNTISKKRFLEKNDFNKNLNSNINISKTIEKMDKMRLIHRNEDREIMDSEYICFSPLNDKNNMLFGNKKGEVEIYDFRDNNNGNEEKYKLLLRIKVLNNEVKYICNIDEDLFAVSERKNIIKIIELKLNIPQYSIIQTIILDDYDDINIYSMISLPLFSFQEKRNFLCIATDKNILIYKSNKAPKYLNNPHNENNEMNLSFELYKTLELYTLTHCLIVVSNKYLVAACPNDNSIKFFDMTNDFIQDANIDDINMTRGSNIFTLIPNENILIVACDNGFKFISIEMKTIYKSVDFGFQILSIDMLNENNIISCCSEGKRNKINQYEINKKNMELKKISQRTNKNNDEIWKLQKINGRIFFINNQNIVNFLE